LFAFCACGGAAAAIKSGAILEAEDTPDHHPDHADGKQTSLIGISSSKPTQPHLMIPAMTTTLHASAKIYRTPR
jgi:hypothetical protein